MTFSRKKTPETPPTNAETKKTANSTGKAAVADLPAQNQSVPLTRKPIEPKELAQTPKRAAGARKLNKITKLTVHYDAGFGNNLFIRGQGANLSWIKGVQLKNENNDLWSWETDIPFAALEYKILINDIQYEQGPNNQLQEGDHHHHHPSF